MATGRDVSREEGKDLKRGRLRVLKINPLCLRDPKI